MGAIFMVRAQVVDATAKEGFERWYRDDHLPDALKTFGARRAWRAWSDADPSVHYAMYEFDSIDQVRALPGSAGMTRMVKDFDDAWGKRVVRSRDSMTVVQEAER
ncbi:MAG: hypothetical protein ACREVQ_03505 [Burkholderiales bacterium]